MDRHTRIVAVLLGVIGLAVVASGCEIAIPSVDCSWINQPDMGGLVCLGANYAAWVGGLLVLLLGLGVAVGGVG